MLQNAGKPIIFSALFTKGGAWFNPVGGVTVEVYRRRLDTGAIEYVVATGATEPGAFGVYHYRLNNPDVAGTYTAIFNSADVTVDKKSQMDVWNVGVSALLQVASTVQPDPESFSQFDVPLSAQTDVRFSQPLLIPGRDITGWTALTFTVKRSPDSDLDSDALLTVRISNPANPATDGILLHRGRPVDPADPLRTAGTVAVLAVSPDTQLTPTLTAAGMDIPPNPENEPYTYEIDVWRTATAGDKEQIAQAEFAVGQSVRRSPVAP